MWILVAVLAPLHLWAMWSLSRIVVREKPEWLKDRGSLGFLYEGMPPIANPSVQMRVMGIAFQRRVHELSPPATNYAWLVRIATVPLLLLAIVVFFDIAVAGV